MSSKKEDLHIQLQDSVRKLEYMINDVIERFDFDQGATTDPEEAMVFAYNRGNMWTQLEISVIIFWKLKSLRVNWRRWVDMDYKEKINELLNDLGQIELRYIYIIVSDVHKETQEIENDGEM